MEEVLHKEENRLEVYLLLQVKVGLAAKTEDLGVMAKEDCSLSLKETWTLIRRINEAAKSWSSLITGAKYSRFKEKYRINVRRVWKENWEETKV